MATGVYREACGSLQLVGTLDDRPAQFTYDDAYLAAANVAPISCSLPLRREPYLDAEVQPYFRGLLPEGEAYDEMAARLGLRSGDYIGMLSQSGLDCVGDVIFAQDFGDKEASYLPIPVGQIAQMATRPDSTLEILGAVRPSIAGTLGKVGLYHDDGRPLDDGWYRSYGTAASNMLVKFARASAPYMMLNECLCLRTARHCGIRTAGAWLLPGHRDVLCVRRFDREGPSGRLADGLPVPLRRHQEDLAQAFGVRSNDKYDELPGGSLARIVRLLRERSVQPARDIVELLRITLFNYLIGNCDNHLKNLSLLYSPSWKDFALAPAYDLMCTTAYGYSREMGMALGGTRMIDEVSVADLRAAATDFGIGARVVRREAHKLAEGFGHALHVARDELVAEGFEEDAVALTDEFEDDWGERAEPLARV